MYTELKNNCSLYELLSKIIPIQKKDKQRKTTHSNDKKKTITSPSSNPRKAEYMKASGRY
jgi:hypothetical protein